MGSLFWPCLVVGVSIAVAGCATDTPDEPETDVDGGAPAELSSDAGPPADTWQSFAGEFTSTYCVGCHDEPARDYRLLDHVARDAVSIRCGVSSTALPDCGAWPPPRQFPIGNGLQPTDEERDRFVRWIDDGMLAE